MASFSGAIEIEGNYEITLQAIDEEEYKPVVSFHPDERSLRYLPKPHSSMEGYDTLPKAILLTNSDKSTKLLLSKSEYKGLMKIKYEFDSYSLDERMSGNHTPKTFQGFKRIKIDGYTTAIECDTRWYSARLLSVEKINRHFAVSTDGHLPC